MKRHSAGKNTDMRKRTEAEVARPFGPLTEEEIEDLCQAYRDGCGGEVMIGLRGDERVMTMLLPAQSGQDATESQMIRVAEQLRAIGCDRYLHIRRLGGALITK